MAVVSGTFTTSGESAEFTPTQDVSELRVSGGGPGQVYLWSKTSSGSWLALAPVRGSMIIQTPDYTILYKFIASAVGSDVAYYMGP